MPVTTCGFLASTFCMRKATRSRVKYRTTMLVPLISYAVGSVIAVDERAEGRAKAHSPLRPHPAVAESDGFDLDDTVEFVKDERIATGAFSVDPSRIRDEAAFACATGASASGCRGSAAAAAPAAELKLAVLATGGVLPRDPAREGVADDGRRQFRHETFVERGSAGSAPTATATAPGAGATWATPATCAAACRPDSGVADGQSLDLVGVAESSDNPGPCVKKIDADEAGLGRASPGLGSAPVLRDECDGGPHQQGGGNCGKDLL